MDSIRVTGNGPLSGTIQISGAKNSALKLMAAALLSDAPLTLANAPRLSDMRMMAVLLRSLGVEIAELQDGQVLSLSAKDITSVRAEYDIVRKMRASINVLGPLLSRFGKAEVSLPGGCAIGARPVDLHLRALEALGAEIELVEGYVHATAPRGLKGAEIEFPFVSVGATENAMTAAVFAQGTTVLRNAAQEPEIADLANCLNAMGTKISGAGTSEIVIEGVTSLKPASHSVIADRIELGTYMMAPVIAGGTVTLQGGRRDLVGALCEKLEAAGVSVTETADGLTVSRALDTPVRAVDVTTAPFPGFPTDLQAQFMAAMCTAEGVSTLEETIFENRFMHAPELIRMGAEVDVQGGRAVVTGVKQLRGAPVMATDLRASVSLILAGLAAEGVTMVNRVYHLDRGYEHLEQKLAQCGAIVERVAE